MSEHEKNSQVEPSEETHSIRDWADLGQEMWSYLTGRHAMVNYSFEDMTVEVPRDIGPDAPRAVWKFNGSVKITTNDDHVRE
ncbi:hypothetical protein GCM10022198_03570 [Klugiella xanthotipulae]|uniref:Uncharacterized protein n=1 Tax=Klugiella xanthotipulae TaxID=244735 RepID=A0A543I6V8_9MICO|nr:hypothetical protein [Klugiella xanthotipulae]TQM66346.1 hypothetical protein FB466_1186 [Klugiella xanthotipulae]